MRLLVLCQDPDGPVVRHRVRAILSHLVAEGFDDVAIEAIPRRLSARISLFRQARHAAVTVLVRKLLVGAQLAMLRASARRLVYDVDDAVMFRDPFRGRPRSRVRAARFRKTVRAADVVLAGNAYLAGCAAEAGSGGTAIVEAPTPVDTDRYVPGDAPREGARRIGWIGSRSTLPYLRAIAQPLGRVMAERDDVSFAVMADAPPDVPFAVDFTPWSEAAEVPWLQSLSAGVMPLTDDPWSRGKCGFKLLQYLACGVPAVASPVGANVGIADEGRAAILADDDDGWHAALTRVLDDDEHAASLAERGRAHVTERFAASIVGPRVARVLAGCARSDV
jgi:glycosyltransferase involved in cell wall biosynthesis